MKNDQEDSQKNYPVGRRTILAALGIGGLGLYSDTTRASEADTSQNSIYNWQQDVDANSHELSDLGALSMAAGSDSVVDFAGENLSIDESGTLNASAAGGIAAPGERVLLYSATVQGGVDFHGSTEYTTGDYPSSAHPFPIGQMNYSNIGQLYVSITATNSRQQDSSPAYLRAYDFTSEAPIEGTEVKVGDSDYCPRPTIVEGPAGEYDAEESVVLGIQTKETDLERGRTGRLYGDSPAISDPTLNIWGEVV